MMDHAVLQIFLTTLLAACVVMVTRGDVVDIVPHEEPAPPPRPYSFKYQAGRFPGHVDRQHVESSDGSGVVRGSFSYIGPRQQIRTVEYVADENGFHPLVHNPVQDTPSVAVAKQKHAELFQKIAYEHAQIAAERAALKAAAGPEQPTYDY